MISIPGAKPNPLTSQLLVSSGVPTLDKVLGGGLPVGSITLIEEDEYGIFAKTLLRYFLVEGIASEQYSLTVSLDSDPNEILKSLPALAKEQPKSQSKTTNNEQMKIAFRYQNLPTNESEVESIFGHYYDLSEYMPSSDINLEKHVSISEEDIKKIEPITKHVFKSSALNVLLHKINQLVKSEIFCDSEDLKHKNILRICIHQLGTIMWENQDEIPKFLYFLRCILRRCYALAVITIPTHLSQSLKSIYDSRLTNTADIALRLFSFSGTHYEKNKALSDYHGFFYIDKLAAINTLCSPHLEPIEYTFKLLRKKFCIEVLHLPAGIDLDPKADKVKRHSAHAASGCGSSGGAGNSLDF